MSLWSKVKKAAKKVVKTVKKIVRVAKELANRAIGVLDFVASLIGIRPKKYLRLRILIPSDLKKRPVVPEAEVTKWLDATKSVFKERLNIEIRSSNRYFPIIKTLAEPPEVASALWPECNAGWAFSDGADCLDDLCTYEVTESSSAVLDAMGYGELMYAFVVHKVDSGNSSGCAYPPVHDFCVIEETPTKFILAHELCHTAWLKHSSGAQNLMNPVPVGSELSRLQISTVRNSRYVTYLRMDR